MRGRGSRKDMITVLAEAGSWNKGAARYRCIPVNLMGLDDAHGFFRRRVFTHRGRSQRDLIDRNNEASMVHDEAFALLDNLSRLDPVQSTVLAAATKCEIAADHQSDCNGATTICDQAIRLAKDRENNGELITDLQRLKAGIKP